MRLREIQGLLSPSFNRNAILASLACYYLLGFGLCPVAYQGLKIITSLSSISLIFSIGGLWALILLAFGQGIRDKENEIITIWDIIEKQEDISIQDIEISMGLSRYSIFNSASYGYEFKTGQ